MDMRDGLGGTVKPFANRSLAVFGSAARDTTHDSEDLDNLNHRGVQLVVDVTDETVGGSTHSIVVKIQGKDEVSGKYYDLLESAAITATGTNLLTVYPSIAAVANEAVSNALPRTWRVRVEHTADGASDMTYTVGANMLL